MEWMTEVLGLIAHGVLTFASGIGCVHRLRDRDPPGTKKQILGKHAQADPTFQGCCLSSGNPVLRHPGPGTFMLDSARRIQK